MRSQIEQHVVQIRPSINEQLRERFRKEITKPAYGITPDQAFDTLAKCIDVLQTATAQGALESIPIRLLVDLERYLRVVATQIAQNGSPQLWHTAALEIEAALWRAKLLGEEAETQRLDAEISRLTATLASLSNDRRTLDDALRQATGITTLHAETQQRVADVTASVFKVQTAASEIESTAKVVVQAKADSDKALEASRQSDASIQAIRPRIEAFFESIQTTTKALDTLQADVRKVVGDFEVSRDAAMRSWQDESATALQRLEDVERAKLKQLESAVEEIGKSLKEAQESAVSEWKDLSEESLDAGKVRFGDLEGKWTKRRTDLESEWSQFCGVANDTYLKQSQRVTELLELAVGTSLFRAFEVRRKKLSVIAWIWGAGTVVLTVVAAGFVVWLATDVHEAKTVEQVFWIRLSALPLLLFAIGFAASQYAHQRRAEEAYAFKAALSLSLEPYKNLVKEMLRDKADVKNVEFVIETIKQVYRSPETETSGRISRSQGNRQTREVMKLIGEIVKAAKS